ncbi:hypothetical protein GCM10009127_20560 [Alteraurantiacibacter aestuarii]|uniref:TadE/TadG family type IV pilus assembly protein n=1 Tax=Alteraurantiacibacter aestuarii TaxID=650004 RepID=UPI0031D7CCB6
MISFNAMIKRLRSLPADSQGSMAVEFALVGPVLLVLMFGVLQIGMALQNYNAVRNVSADVARYAMVQHQTGNNLSNSQIQTYALNHAQGAPYMLEASRVNAYITTASTQRVSGARELQIVITYEVNSLLDGFGLNGPFVSYTRPIFLLETTTP